MRERILELLSRALSLCFRTSEIIDVELDDLLGVYVFLPDTVRLASLESLAPSEYVAFSDTGELHPFASSSARVALAKDSCDDDEIEMSSELSRERLIQSIVVRVSSGGEFEEMMTVGRRGKGRGRVQVPRVLRGLFIYALFVSMP